MNMIRNNKSSIIFWILSALFLWLFIGSRSEDSFLVLVFVALLMPVTVITSYVINHVLIAGKLMKGKLLEFAIYGVFTVVLSVYVQAIFVMVAFALYADFSYAAIGPVIGNVMYLAVGTYLVILMNSVIFLVRHKNTAAPIGEDVQPDPVPVLQVMANRKQRLIDLSDILYVESMSNYVKIHTAEEVVITKEKISKLEEKLPDGFIRIHRSFIVNRDHVTHFGKENLEINHVQLNISRTYKKAVLEQLETNHSSNFSG